MKLRFFLLSAILLTLSTAAFAQAESKNDTELKALVQRMVGAQMAFDEKSLDAIFTADYIEVSPLGEVDPREKVLGFYKRNLHRPAARWRGSRT